MRHHSCPLALIKTRLCRANGSDIITGLSEAQMPGGAKFTSLSMFNPYPTAFPYGNGMVLHFYQQQESSTTKTVHRVINKGLKSYV